MGIFKRGKDGREKATGLDAAEVADVEVGDEPTDDAPAAPATDGPIDRSAVADDSGYLNLGHLWIRGIQGMELRLEINEQEQQITGLTAVLGESAVQLQVFAAPRTEGIWIDIRNEIAASITDAGGTAEVVTGPFGEELQTRMPQTAPDGRTGFAPARFLGVDGPRWFLRAVVTGRAAVDGSAAGPVHQLIRTAVIDRGGEARPPRELLPLRLPEQAQPESAPAESSAPRADELRPFERGPEITEVR